MAKGYYLGGHTTFRDPGFHLRVNWRMRKTARRDEAVAREREKLAAEMEAYEASPKSVLIKRCGDS